MGISIYLDYLAISPTTGKFSMMSEIALIVSGGNRSKCHFPTVEYYAEAKDKFAN